MSMESLREEAEHHEAVIRAAEERLDSALEAQSEAAREVRDARHALEAARASGNVPIAAYRIATREHPSKPRNLPPGEAEDHDYEPNDDPGAQSHPMSSEPPCRICGGTRNSTSHTVASR